MSRSPNNKHQQKSEETRRKLLKAARRVFARDGFEAARLEDIAADAGYTRGAFYANFSSKEDLFFALLEQQAYQHREKLKTLLEKCADPADKTAAIRDYYVKRSADRGWVMLMLEFKLFAVRHSRHRAKLASAHRRVRASLKWKLLDDILPAHVRQDACEEGRWAALEANLNGLVLEHAYDPKRITEEQVRSTLKRVFELLVGQE